MKRLFNTVISLALCAILFLSYTACAVTVKAEDLMGGYGRTAADVTLTDEQKTAGQKAYADFAFTLFTQALKDEQTKNVPNRMISPLSAMMCLALIANGADGETKAQMENALGLPVDELNRFLYDYWQSIDTSDDCKIALANSVWYNNADQNLTVKPEFLQAVADWYAAQAYAAPFDAATVKDVNKWCADHTDGMIDKILDTLNRDDMMILINALMFDAKWQNEYEKSHIKDDQFRNADNTLTDVKMLRSEENTFLWGDNFRAFTKYYKGGRYAFVGMLPDEGVDVMDLAASLSGDVWAQTWAQKEVGRSVYAGIPEFSFDFDIRLDDTLKAMGMTNLFSPTFCDLSRAASYEGQNLYMGLVEQKTHIELDRNGTKAAAITWGIMKAGSAAPSDEPIYIILDRPFVYAIVDTKTGTPLFVGVVTDLG